MGYYVKTEEVDITIPKQWLESAYKAVIGMNENDTLKRGGSHGPNSERKFWFSWMPEDLSTLTDIHAVLLELGFEDTTYNDDGDLVVGHYDNKSGQEDLFFDAIGPFVKENSYAVWKGEDGEVYKWVFTDSKMLVVPGFIAWDMDNAYSALDEWVKTQTRMNEMRKIMDAKSESLKVGE